MMALWFKADAGAALVMAALLCAPVPVRAAEPDPVVTGVRIADHGDFGRIVFDMPKGAAYDLAIEGDRALVVFRGAGTLMQPDGVPRNVVSVRVAPGTATVVLKPGTRLHAWRLGDRLLLDALDARAPAPAEQDARPAAAGTPAMQPMAAPSATARAPREKASRDHAARGRPVEGHAATVHASTEQGGRRLPDTPPPAPAIADSAPAKAPEAAPVVPVRTEALPGSAAVGAAANPPADPAADAADAARPALPAAVAAGGSTAPPPPPGGVVKADADVGAAAFRRGPLGVLVLDRRMPMAAPAWLPGASVVLGAVSTVVQVPLAADQALAVSRAAGGWSVAIMSTVPEAALAPQPADVGLAFTVPRAGRVVAVLDPLTGGTLLVGASLGAGPSTAVADGRRTPYFTLLPTWLGVAVEPLTDRVDLQVGAPGFVLTGAPSLPPAPMAVRGRRFDIPDEPPGALLNRLQAQLASAAAAPPRARTKDRMAAAQTMIALGMGIEAQSMMQQVASDDPQAAADARVQALAGIAAVMGGRLDEAKGLDDTRLDEAGPGEASVPGLADQPRAPDEIMLWRGLRDRRLGLVTAAAQRLPSQRALAQAYPATLRRLVWPEVAEAAVEAGAPLEPDALPPLARAMLLEKQGKIAEAKAAYAALDAGTDRLDQVRAASRLTELRLASGEISPSDAADAMERLTFAWRGDAREATLRLRTAELRAASGAWRPALDFLRQTETLFPDRKALVQARKASVFQTMLESHGSGMSPLEVVLLAAEYADCLPDGPSGTTLAALLADKLLALDLPARAIPVLQGLMRGAPAGAVRAEFGHRLAQLLLDGGDADGAVATLQASAAPGIAPAVQEARALVMARALASQGDMAGAVAGLTEIRGAAADDLRATLLARAGDVRGSLAALSDLAARIVPPDGPLPDAAQDVLMRQAAAAAQAPDPAALRALERYVPRMAGPRADLLRVLTAPPLVTTAELPRAARELTLARAIPQRIQALGEK